MVGCLEMLALVVLGERATTCGAWCAGARSASHGCRPTGSPPAGRPSLPEYPSMLRGRCTMIILLVDSRHLVAPRGPARTRWTATVELDPREGWGSSSRRDRERSQASPSGGRPAPRSARPSCRRVPALGRCRGSRRAGARACCGTSSQCPPDPWPRSLRFVAEPPGLHHLERLGQHRHRRPQEQDAVFRRDRGHVTILDVSSSLVG